MIVHSIYEALKDNSPSNQTVVKDIKEISEVERDVSKHHLAGQHQSFFS